RRHGKAPERGHPEEGARERRTPAARRYEEARGREADRRSVRRVPRTAVDAREEERRAERREERSGDGPRLRRSIGPQREVERRRGRAAGDPRRQDLRVRGRDEWRERQREDRRQGRIDDAPAAVAAREQLVEPGPRLVEPPLAR